ncbi:MAG: LemA-like protein [Parcubacteria group bacterium GW2011_GWC2_44_17]|nr:MAG: LemA-like protein [Parcubacteria group bacterium GW2011_GWC2_44_17]KKT48323.1 MAG: LemA-like protein [Parcubacteria group bacterium GW2011_GWF2_44_17]
MFYKNMTTFLYIIIGAIVLIVLWLVAAYNGLITKRNRVDEGWSDIEVQLKRRHSLIPNLVETVKGYASHESGVFEKVTEARSNAISAKTPQEHLQAENMLSGALKTLFAVTEAYPELKANQNFAKLQDELTDTEDKIQAARRFYNGQVRDYTTAIQRVPTNIVANFFHFTAREFYDLDETPEAREDVKVKF